MTGFTLQIVGGLSKSSEYIILFTLGAAVSALLIGFLFKQIRRYGAYAYANARVNAMKGRLFKDDKLEPLIQTQNLQNLFRKLEDSEYSTYLEKIEELTSVNVERSLNHHLADVHEKISKIAPEDVKTIFQEMEKIHEIENLKTILVDRFIGKTPEETEKKLLPKKFLSEETYAKAIRAENISNAILAFENTEYGGPLEEASTEFEERKNLLPLLLSLEKKYWRKIWKTSKESNAKYSKTIQKVLSKKIDIQNILIVLRCKSQEVDSEDIKELVIPIDSELKRRILEKAIEAKSWEETFTVLEDSPYKKALSEARKKYENTKSISSSEKILNEFLLRKLRALSIEHYTEAGPLIGFFYEKNFEVKNLITIVNGKAEGLETEEIKEYLVTPEVEI